MAQYTRYEKLQKYYKDGTAVTPAEYKKGKNLGVAEYSSIEECQNSSTPPTPLTNCIKWEAHKDLNFNFNNNAITTKENPWCTQEKVSSLDFHNSNSEIVSLDITIDETNSITSLSQIFENMPYLKSVKLNIPKAASLSNIYNMFANSKALTSINFINFDTSNVRTVNHAFENCSSLTSIDVSNWNTSNVVMADYMFSGCSSLTSLNLKNFDMSKANSYGSMFAGCNKLKNIICKQAFKNWCITNQNDIGLPPAMREGGTGTWTIVN